MFVCSKKKDECQYFLAEKKKLLKIQLCKIVGYWRHLLVLLGYSGFLPHENSLLSLICATESNKS